MAATEQGGLPIIIEALDLNAATNILPDLKPLLDAAYHDSHMYRDLGEDVETAPDPFRLFVARSDGVVVGTAVVERKPHEDYDYSVLPPVHLKRFTVAKAIRGLGIGQRLVTASKDYAFGDEGLSVLFGESNEIGALSFYGREGAVYRRTSIESYWRRNSPVQALTYFALDLTDVRRREERYPNGSGIHFAFPADDKVKEALTTDGFVPKAEVIQNLPLHVVKFVAPIDRQDPQS